MRNHAYLPSHALPHLARARHLIVLLCVSLPSFMINLDANVVAVSLPTMARSMHADFAAIEWVVSAYTITFGCLVLPAGRLADRYGRKPVLLFGVGLYGIASLFCSVAPSLAVLDGARALQGVGAALQLSASLAILSHEFSGDDRGRAFAFWGMSVGVAIAIGPIVGGLVTQMFGWEWVFRINPLIGVGLVLLTFYAVTDSASPGADRVDVPGVVLFSTGVFALTLALISGNARGWSNVMVVLAFGCAAALLAGFLVAEALQRQPMVDLRLFKQRTFLGANIAALAFAATLLMMLTYLPIYFQGALDCSPLQAGLLMLPLTAALIAAPRFAAVHLNSRLSGRALLTAGLTLLSIGLVALAIAVHRFNYRTMLTGLLAAGAGGGVLNSEVVKVGMTVVPADRAGMASGVSGTVRFTGIVIGFATLGAVLAARVTAALGSGLERLGPTLGGVNRAALGRSVVAGDLSGPISAAPVAVRDALRKLTMTSFADGFQAILFTTAAFAAVAALLTWGLVRRQDTSSILRKQ